MLATFKQHASVRYMSALVFALLYLVLQIVAAAAKVMLLQAVFLTLKVAHHLQDRHAAAATLTTTGVGLATSAVAPAALAIAIGARAALALCQRHL